MNVNLEQWSGWHIVAMEGNFVLRDLNQARKTFESLVSTPNCKVLLDLAKTRLVDSSVLSFLANLHKRLRDKGGTFAMSGPNPEIRLVFSVVGIEGEVRVFDSRAEFESAVLAGASGF